MTPRTDPFCDYLNITTPGDDFDSVHNDLLPILDVVAERETDSLYRSRFSTGTFKIRQYAALGIYGTSGQLLTDLRSMRLYDDFLMVFASRPHRVTSCDLTVHEYVDPPPVIERVLSLGYSGQVAFTRKAVHPNKVREVRSLVKYDDTGRMTGTAYLGTSQSEASAKVYDKTQERFEKGVQVPPTVAHEIKLTHKLGVTLKDVHTPYNCFYHFYPSILLEPPFMVPDWVSGESGFELARRELLPAQRLKQLVQSSRDIARAVRLAEECGPGGLKLLLRYVSELADAGQRSQAQGILETATSSVH